MQFLSDYLSSTLECGLGWHFNYFQMAFFSINISPLPNKLMMKLSLFQNLQNRVSKFCLHPPFPTAL